MFEIPSRRRSAQRDRPDTVRRRERTCSRSATGGHHADASPSRSRGGQAADEAGRVGGDPPGGVSGDLRMDEGEEQFAPWTTSSMLRPVADHDRARPALGDAPARCREVRHAEYDEATCDGEWLWTVSCWVALVRARVRGSWSLMMSIHPMLQRDRYLGTGDRLGAELLQRAGLRLCWGSPGAGPAFCVPTAITGIRFPYAWSYPVVLLILHRDRLHRRGGVLWRAAGSAAHRPASTRRWRNPTQAQICKTPGEPAGRARLGPLHAPS